MCSEGVISKLFDVVYLIALLAALATLKGIVWQCCTKFLQLRKLASKRPTR